MGLLHHEIPPAYATLFWLAWRFFPFHCSGPPRGLLPGHAVILPRFALENTALRTESFSARDPLHGRCVHAQVTYLLYDNIDICPPDRVNNPKKFARITSYLFPAEAI